MPANYAEEELSQAANPTRETPFNDHKNHDANKELMKRCCMPLRRFVCKQSAAIVFSGNSNIRGTAPHHLMNFATGISDNMPGRSLAAGSEVAVQTIPLP
jgi:hypothetical protein